MIQLIKYPRTPHIEGSRFQLGDHDLESVPFEQIKGRHIVVEEKLDGANSALRFNSAGKLYLQSRGHFLRGGVREKHFDLFKRWARTMAPVLWPVLTNRYVLYGEWLYAKHTIYYDRLPHFFMEFDLLHLDTGRFLDTPNRRQLLQGLPLTSVPVLDSGTAVSLNQVTRLLGRSQFKGDRWHENLTTEVAARGLKVDLALRETDPSNEMEGLYIKVEEEGHVIERFKFVRASFLTVVHDSNSHWQSRPIIPNRLADGIDLFRG
jgi:hypothetical protein